MPNWRRSNRSARDAPVDADQVLQGLDAPEVPVAATAGVDDVLAGLDTIEEETPDPEMDLSTVLGEFEATEATEHSNFDEVLSGLEPAVVDDDEAATNLDDLLGELETPEPEPDTKVADVLADIDVAAESAEETQPDLTTMLDDVPAAQEEGTSAEDVLPGLGAVTEVAESSDVDLEDLLGDTPPPEADTGSGADDTLAGLDIVEDDAPSADLDLEDMLGDLDIAEPEDALGADDILSSLDLSDDASDDGVDSVTSDGLSGLVADDTPTPDPLADAELSLDLDDLFSDSSDTNSGPAQGSDHDVNDLDLDTQIPSDNGALDDEFDLDALLADEPATDDTTTRRDDLVAMDEKTSEITDVPAEAERGDGLDDLLEGLGIDENPGDDDDDLDALFGALDQEVAADDSSDSDALDALLGDLEGDVEDLDVMLEDQSIATGSEQPGAGIQHEPELAYGTMSTARPNPQKLERKRFRMAVFGDFTGRAAKGQLEIGDTLANRKPMVLDPDTFEEVIESFATELVLPIGKDGAGISVKLGEFDDLHPDELFDNVELFAELISLRAQLQNGVTKDRAMTTLTTWAEAHGTPARAPKSRSGGNVVPADKRLSDFQMLIGNSANSLRTASPVEEMLARVVGPHIRALPAPNLGAMQEAVDLALSDAMRLVLHHPEFQLIEAQWRSLDLMQRSVEVDDTLEVMLYDVSAEELAADLATHEDLSRIRVCTAADGSPNG